MKPALGRVIGLGALFLVLNACHSNQHIQSYQAERYAVKDSVATDQKIEAIISPYREAMAAEMNAVIGTCVETLPKERTSTESHLGNWVSDIVFEKGLAYCKQEELGVTKTMLFTLINKGGLRASLNEGPITKGNIFELMPFDNEIVILKLSPIKIKKMIHYLFMNNGQPVSNAIFYLSSDDGQVSIGGQPYDFKSDVYVVTSDYLAKGGDKMTFFNLPLTYIQTGILIRDAILESVSQTKNITIPEVQNRIQFIRN